MIEETIMLIPQTFYTKGFLASPGDVMHHLSYDASPEACVAASIEDVMHHLLYDASPAPEILITHISYCQQWHIALFIAQPLLAEN